MIGTALSHKEQMNILKKLDKTDIPWNCAHGRVSFKSSMCTIYSVEAESCSLCSHFRAVSFCSAISQP